MTRNDTSKSSLKFQPLTPKRWPDLESLFGERGGWGGCWCMWWRLSRAEFQKRKGQRNKAAFKQIVEDAELPGVLAYANGQPVGWCAVAPREQYPVLERSRTLARADSKAVWSVTCLFVARPFRRAGVSVQSVPPLAMHARAVLPSSRAIRWSRVPTPCPMHLRGQGLSLLFARRAFER